MATESISKQLMIETRRNKTSSKSMGLKTPDSLVLHFPVKSKVSFHELRKKLPDCAFAACRACKYFFSSPGMKPIIATDDSAGFLHSFRLKQGQTFLVQQ